MARFVAGVVVGLLVAVAGLAAHRQVWRSGQVAVPWGLALSLVTLLTTVLAARYLGGVTAVIGTSAGWVATVVWLQTPRPEGDFLLAADALGYGFAVGGMVVALLGVVIAMSRPPRARSRPGDDR